MLDHDGIGARAVLDPNSTPNDLANEAGKLLAELLPIRDAENDSRKRKQLSSRIRAARILRDWAKTRAGYVV